MDRIKKTLNKISEFDRKKLKEAIHKIESGASLDNYDIKKLKGADNLYRIRSGVFRIIYRVDVDGSRTPVSLTKRGDNTYNLI